MQGIRLLIHAINMVLRNLPIALRIAGALAVVEIALNFISGEAGLTTAMQPFGMAQENGAPFVQPSGMVILLTVLQILFGLWVAVAWHRYILLEEAPNSLLPAWKGSAIWAYFKAGFLLGLIVVAAIIPMMLIAGVLVLPFVMANPTSMFWGLLAFVVIYVPAAYVTYRLSPILPSAAIGDRLTLKQAWAATKPSGLAFVSLTIVSIVAAWLLYLPAWLIAPYAWPIAALLASAAQVFTVLVGASMLTTIYGHFVQKRALHV